MIVKSDDKKVECKREWAQRWLSAARLDSYACLSDNDIELALDLHEWNISLGKVLMGDIARFEVALRNAYDRALCNTVPGDTHWLFDDESPVRRPIMRISKSKKLRDVNLVNRRTISEAQRRAHDSKNPDQIIAGLMLGFWTHMTDRSRERDLWIPSIHTVWPSGTDRTSLNSALYAINKMRNRVAHNERLFNPIEQALSPKAVDANVLKLFRVLCPEAAEHLYGVCEKTPVEMFLEKHPAPITVEL